VQIGSIIKGMIPANDPRPERAVQLAIVQFEDAWRILLNGQKVGRFRRHADAVQCALEIAMETRRDGHPVEVLAQDAFGEVTVLDAEAATVQ